jgi:hypothetical protein
LRRIISKQTGGSAFSNDPAHSTKVEPASGDPGDGGTDPEEAAWRTAVDAAPWLVGESEPHEDVPPEELYDKLKPFKDRVAEDIKDGEE